MKKQAALWAHVCEVDFSKLCQMIKIQMFRINPSLAKFYFNRKIRSFFAVSQKVGSQPQKEQSHFCMARVASGLS